MTPNTNRAVAALVCSLAATLLASCGGGGDSMAPPTASAAAATGTPAAALGIVRGTVTGFGSIYIDGVKYDDSTAKVEQVVDPRSPTSVTTADVKLGMRAEVQLVEGKIGTVSLLSEVLGPVTSIDLANSTFTVLGQRVRVAAGGAATTIFDGLSGISALQVGDLVEVHGTRLADGVVAATRVERRPADSLVRLRASGVVASLDATAKTFKLGDLTVAYSGAVLLPAGAVLENGKSVAVFSDALPVAGTINARAVKLADAGLSEIAATAIGGVITDFASQSSFKVGAVTVDASAATFGNGTAASLANGQAVRVEGVISAGVLKARAVAFVNPADAAGVSLAGQVTDFVSVANFKVRGTVVDASAAAFAGGTGESLGNGSWVAVSGKAGHVDYNLVPNIVYTSPEAASVGLGEDAAKAAGIEKQ